jgi:predicted enzyme related to lactoylglutathione lyase
MEPMMQGSTESDSKRITQVTLIVEDQSKALEFYTEKVGFEKKIDFRNPGGVRWVTVGPKGQDVNLALAEARWPDIAGRKWKADGAPPIVIEVEDCRKTYDELKSRGVEFTMELKQVPYGTVAFFADPDGNMFEILQSPPKAKS